MKKQTQKSIVLKRKFQNLMSILLPIAKKMLGNKINQIKSNIIQKILPNRFKKRQNTLKNLSNRRIRSLENNFSAEATKNIINTPKILTEKSPTVAKPNVLTSAKIGTKPKKAIKLQIVDKPKIIVEKTTNYREYKNHVINQLKKTDKKVV